jgi:hypothetical protein
MTMDPENTLSISQCPLCGFQPIPDGAVKCPRCTRTFTSALKQVKGQVKSELRASKVQGAPSTLKRHISVDHEAATILGTTTTELPVPFVPGPSAVLLLAGAIIWFLRVIGIGLHTGEPAWVYAVVGVDLVLAPAVLMSLGPSRHLATAAFAIQLVVSAVLSGTAIVRPAALLYALHAGTGLLTTLANPSPARRRAAMLAGLVVAILAGVLLARSPPSGTVRKELVSDGMGYRLLLPAGWKGSVGEDRLAPELVAPHLTIPGPSSGSTVFFGSAQGGAYGVLTVQRDRGAQLIGGCQSYLESLGATSSPRPLAVPAPAALGDVALVYELSSRSGAVGRLGCAKLEDGRFVALAVVLAGGDSQASQATFDLVGQGLNL